MKNTKINPNDMKIRDLLMVRLINGATKASIKPDRKKKLNKAKCRGKVTRNDD